VVKGARHNILLSRADAGMPGHHMHNCAATVQADKNKPRSLAVNVLTQSLMYSMLKAVQLLTHCHQVFLSHAHQSTYVHSKARARVRVRVQCPAHYPFVE
jgi:hypothetical protein